MGKPTLNIQDVDVPYLQGFRFKDQPLSPSLLGALYSARGAAQRSYDSSSIPSEYARGAAILTRDGEIILGANQHYGSGASSLTI